MKEQLCDSPLFLLAFSLFLSPDKIFPIVFYNLIQLFVPYLAKIRQKEVLQALGFLCLSAFQCTNLASNLDETEYN